YEAVLGNELRPFDPNQGNYILELSTSYRIKRTEVAAIFHHVSRHLSDRRKVIPIAWNILGVRALREARIGKGTIDVVADFGGTTEKVNVDYRWSSNVDVVVRRQLYPHAGVFARGSGHLMSVRSAAIRPNRLDYQLATLPNGLTVVLSEDHSTPIVHVQLWYHVGSKNEKAGRTGFAHLFEHLMFKGSKNVQPEGHTSMISGRGGQ